MFGVRLVMFGVRLVMFGVRLVMFGAQALFVGDTLAGVPTGTRYKNSTC